MIKLTGLKKATSKSGVGFLVGKLGVATVFVFKNTRKTAEDPAEYNLYIEESRQPDRQDGGGKKSGQTGNAETKRGQ